MPVSPAGQGENKRMSGEALLVYIKAIYAEVKKEYGSPKIWKELLARGIRVGKERVRKLMQRHGIKARGKRKEERGNLSLPRTASTTCPSQRTCSIATSRPRRNATEPSFVPSFVTGFPGFLTTRMAPGQAPPGCPLRRPHHARSGRRTRSPRRYPRRGSIVGNTRRANCCG